MSETTIQDLADRLERERRDADHRYHAALAELDRRANLAHDRAAGAQGGDGPSAAEFAEFQTSLLLFLQTLTAYIDTKDRSIGSPALREQIVLANERTLALARDLRKLQTDGLPGGAPRPAEPATGPGDDFAYVGFEDRFRGSRETIRERLSDYIPLFRGASDVLDVGCGRGEFLELLRDAGVPARGIDSNAAMVAACASRDLEASHAGALEYLEALPDGSLGGLAAIQVVEHLSPAYLSRFLQAASLKLRRGAPMVLETINPGCWMAFFETYLRDLTHANPLHADVLRYLVESNGFTSVDVRFRSPVRAEDQLERIEPRADAPASLRDAIAVVNANSDKLNGRLFGYMDYTIIARH